MASLHIRAARGARHLLHLTGALTCLFAIFISGGGHWAVLQSIAYTRMVVEFAHQDSLCTALKKAFDERYACPLCPKIRDGYNKQHNSPSTLNEVHQLEFLAQSSDSVSFLPEIAADIAFVSPRHMDFLSAPPKPPPRIA
jgi:hypothetical protein